MRRTFIALFCLLLATLSPPASATNFSFSGIFHNDDDAERFDFTINRDAAITLRSYSYGGGTNAMGRLIKAGGFDAILSVFDLSTGQEVKHQDDSSETTPDPITGAYFDVNLPLNLGPGRYTAYVSQFDNFAGSALGNFRNAGQHSFTADHCPGKNAVPGGAGYFCDVHNAQRTGEWAFDILGVDKATDTGTIFSAAVPEPSTWLLMVSGFVVIGTVMRRRARPAAETRPQLL